jgi:hypothetical protein
MASLSHGLLIHLNIPSEPVKEYKSSQGCENQLCQKDVVIREMFQVSCRQDLHNEYQVMGRTNNT